MYNIKIITHFNLFKQHFIENNFKGFCSALDRFNIESYSIKEMSNVKKNIWNILIQYKPDEPYINDTAYWFEPFLKEPRIEILNKIIKDLEL